MYILKECNNKQQSTSNPQCSSTHNLLKILMLNCQTKVLNRKEHKVLKFIQRTGLLIRKRE